MLWVLAALVLAVPGLAAQQLSTAAGRVLLPRATDTVPLARARVLLHQVGRNVQGPIDSADRRCHWAVPLPVPRRHERALSLERPVRRDRIFLSAGAHQPRAARYLDRAHGVRHLQHGAGRRPGSPSRGATRRRGRRAAGARSDRAPERRHPRPGRAGLDPPVVVAHPPPRYRRNAARRERPLSRRGRSRGGHRQGPRPHRAGSEAADDRVRHRAGRMGASRSRSDRPRRQ